MDRCQKGLRFPRSRMAKRDDGLALFSSLVVRDSSEIKQDLGQKSGNDYKARGVKHLDQSSFPRAYLKETRSAPGSLQFA